MKRLLRGWRWPAAALALAVALFVRNEPAPPGPASLLRPDAPLLLDLDDDADADTLARVARAVRGAIAPAAWPSGTAALGQLVSAPARLYRLRGVPPSELADLRAALEGSDGIEGLEAEGRWAIPCLEAPGTCGDLRPLGPTGNAPRPDRRGRFAPNDPYYKHQWHLDQIGMPEAWTVTRGKGAVVAVLDTGVSARPAAGRPGAPDLAGTRVVEGWDFVDGDADPGDLHGHGTHVAGTIAQTTNNGVGVAGVAPEVALMPVRVLDARGAGGWGTVAAGIRWAADHGAHVINLSLGGPIPSATVRRAVDHAHRKGVVVVAAAGNAGAPRVGYPAGYPHAVSVGAVRFDETLAFYSNHGKRLDVVAPGGDLRVDQNGDGLPDGVLQNMPIGRDKAAFDYVPLMGTSMAAPHVAGVAALLVARGVDDPDAVASLLRRTARAVDDPSRTGSGLVSASDALGAARRAPAAARGLLAVGLVPVLLVGLRRRVGIFQAVAWAALAAGALGAVAPVEVPAGPVDLVLAPVDHLGPDASWLALVVLGPWIPLGLVAVLGGRAWAIGPLVGLAIGFAAANLGEALWPVRHFGAADALVGAVLWAQALLGLGLTRLVARSLPGEARRRGPRA